MKPIIAPSILAADFTNLGHAIELINQSQADWIHFDVMDGHFVPNISFGLPVCEAVHRISRKPLDVHLMISDPDRYLEAFVKAGAAHITVHYEACTHLHRTISHIRQLGCRAGVALNPHTPVHLLEDIIEEVDILLIMSVNPGFGGQQFIEHTYQKITKASQLISQYRSPALIEIDGGVNEKNAPFLLKSGAHALVAGNFVFSSPDPSKIIQNLKNIEITYNI